jgi:hypothetical protein
MATKAVAFDESPEKAPEKTITSSPTSSEPEQLHDAEASGISTRKLLRKLDARLLPPLALLYLLSFLDRSNGMCDLPVCRTM